MSDKDDWNDDWGDDWGDDNKIEVSLEKETPQSKRTRAGSSKGHFTAWEDQTIRDEWETSTDEEIGGRLGRTTEAISRRRKILGFLKGNGRPKKSTRKKAVFENPTDYSLSKLSKADRIEFYKVKFEQNHRYQWLLRTLLEDEIEYYKIKYIEILDSLDSVTHQEEDILHHMIMKEIQITRIQTQIKDALEDYLDRDGDDDRRPPPQYLYQDQDKAEQQYVKYQEKLRLTREQRLKIDKEEKITIASLVKDLLDKENRRKSGEIAGQLSYFTDTCRDEMLKNKFLIGE
jgi:hypothetical protein